jgi:hypothetical protein
MGMKDSCMDLSLCKLMLKVRNLELTKLMDLSLISAFVS